MVVSFVQVVCYMRYYLFFAVSTLIGPEGYTIAIAIPGAIIAMVMDNDTSPRTIPYLLNNDIT